jgi:hypothetical protein
VLTTVVGARRLGGTAEGLAPWDETVLARDGRTLRITATPARHGPAGIEPFAGDVIGFVITPSGGATRPIYVTGDTVWYDGVAEVARRVPVALAVLFMGAARVPEVGPAHLTFTASEAAAAAQAFGDAPIVPLHYEGWAHFSESRADVEAAFLSTGLRDRLEWLAPGVPRHFELGSTEHGAQVAPQKGYRVQPGVRV